MSTSFSILSKVACYCDTPSGLSRAAHSSAIFNHLLLVDISQQNVESRVLLRFTLKLLGSCPFLSCFQSFGIGLSPGTRALLNALSQRGHLFQTSYGVRQYHKQCFVPLRPRQDCRVCSTSRTETKYLFRVSALHSLSYLIGRLSGTHFFG